MMTPGMIWANLAVSDLQRTTRFYNALGFSSNGKPNNELTSLLFGKGNFVINFFLKGVLEANTSIIVSDSQQANEVIFTISASTRAEVDSWAREVEPAGGTLVSQPKEFGNNYYGFVFADPDGHKFNVFQM